MQHEVSEGYRLSPQQEQVWVAQQPLSAGPPLSPRSVCSISLRGRLDSALLVSSFDFLVHHHDILRTRFHTLPGMRFPLQVIDERTPLKLRELDLRTLAETTRLETVSSLVAHAAQSEWTASVPVLELCLLRLTDDEHLLIATLPLLCVDSRTWQNLLREVVATYESLEHGFEPAAPEVGLSYAAFAEWQHELLAAKETLDGQRFWSEQDYSGWTRARLPFVRRAATFSTQSFFSPLRFTHQLDPEMTARLATLAAEHQTSRAVLLLTCWQTLLWRLCEATEFILGVSFDGRTDEELDHSLGLFARTLPLSCRISVGTRWEELVGQVDQIVREATQWQECFIGSHAADSLDKVNGSINQAMVDMLPVCFAYEQEAKEVEAGGLRVSIHSIEGCTERFEVKLVCVEHVQDMTLEFHYDAARFDPAQIERLAAQFATVLESALAAPSTRVEEIELAGAEEREKLLVEWNDTRAEYPQDVCLHELFERQAEQTPKRIAVVCGDERVSYRELNDRAGRLAAYLRSCGVGPEVLVGILMERSLDLLVALLGVLKAGGAYLPMDISYPAEMTHFMLEDAGLEVLLTHKELAEKRPELHAVNRVRVICVDEQCEEIESANELESGKTEQAGVGEENLAYVIYTSGSTGRPKGVMITHGAIVNHMQWMKECFPLGEDDVVLQKTPISFDASVWEFYAPLISGARLVMAEPLGHRDAEYLLRVTREQAVSVLQVVPTMLRTLVENGGLRQCHSLRRLYSGGEVLTAQLAWRVAEQMSWARLYNLYGPTETAIDATWWEHVDGERDEGNVAIGRPIGNMRAFVLDGGMRLVGVGVAGELYLGGSGVGRGYLKRADLTAERYVPDPYSGQAGGRLYRTGDLVRREASGELVYVGRVDRQVKVRGYRIELGEVEAALREVEGISESVVEVTRDGDEGTGRLVAYLVTEREASKILGAVRGHVRQRLPEYMLPSDYVVLRELPLTPGGKLDHQRLLAIAPGEGSFGDAHVAQRTPVEELLAGIWSGVLGVEQVGRNDNFFELGGHSLLATNVMARVRETFCVELPLRRLFECPTVAELAASIETEIKIGHGLQSPPIKIVPRNGGLPLSFAQQRLWFLDQLKLGGPSNNIPGALRIKGPLNSAALEQSLDEIFRRHESLRTILVTLQGEPKQVIADGARPRVSLVEVSGLSEAERESEMSRLVIEDAARPFDLSRGPLLRASLIRLAPEEHVLLVTMHHIISDGWSLGVFVRELGTLYEAYCQGLPSSLPELALRYADYAVWQRDWLRGEVLERQVAYWKQQLEDAPPVLELPLDRHRPPAQSFRGALHSMTLAPGLTEALKGLSRSEDTTLFMSLLAAFDVLLYHYTKQEDIVVGTDVANRNRIETEEIIGFFVNQLVLRTKLSGGPTFREILQRVRESTLGAYTHQDMPFDKLVEALNPERSLTHSPLFQVKLVLQNAPMPPLELMDLSLSLIPVENHVSRFDLTLLCWEEDGGLHGCFEYKTDLFNATTISRIAGLFEAIIETVVTRPDIRLDELEEIMAGVERRQRAEESNKRAESNFKRFTSVKPKAISLPEDRVVRTGHLQPSMQTPLVLQPNVAEFDLADWAKANTDFIERELLKHGALLFRGFKLSSAADFERFALTLSPQLFNENGEHPREAVSGNVYTPVFYPADQQLLWHNENSFNRQWPMKIWFCCCTPPEKGGETPIVDSRKVFELIDPRIREQFIAKGVMYVRNYGENLGLSWRAVFQTGSKAEVERRCRSESIDFEWKSGDRLKTRSVRPAVGKHPRTGELVWFNQAQHWHLSCLDRTTRESLQAVFEEEELPRNCYYGDGSVIEDSVMDEILETYRKLEVTFSWQKWDILMLDNMLSAHGRNPFTGERKLFVAMGEMSAYPDS